MDLSAQAKVLRALQEGKITRVGGDKEIKVDVRVVAATNKDLLAEIDAKHFRMDLYHRLSVILLHVPSLNDRKDDIPLLSNRFVKEICEDYGMPIKTITPSSFEALNQFDYTGNIRELRNIIERLVILGGEKISEDDVNNFVSNAVSAKSPKLLFDQFEKFQDFKEYMERMFIEDKLKKNSWNVSKTADILDIQRSHLYNKIEKYDLKRE